MRLKAAQRHRENGGDSLVGREGVLVVQPSPSPVEGVVLGPGVVVLEVE